MKAYLHVIFLLLLSANCFSQTSNTEKRTYPTFKTGKKAFHDSLMKNIFIRPQRAYELCLSGIVVVSFLVKSDGTIDSIITEHSVHPVLDQHAHFFILNQANMWNPGTLDGVPHAMRKTICFVYGLNHFSNASHIALAGLSTTVFVTAESCPDGDSYYKIGVKAYNHKNYELAWRNFKEANRRDFIHLDAIDMLKKTSDILGIPCDVCRKLELFAEYSDREIKRIRDQYCTKKFQPLEKSASNPNIIYRFVDDMPRPKSEVADYVNKHLQYPPSARENCVQSTVIVRFAVMENGAVDSVQTFFSVDSLLDQEAVRVVRSMKDFWEPGTLEGKPVKVFHQIPVNFTSNAPSCHNDEWYYAEGEKAYEQDKMSEALIHFQRAFKINCTNFKAAYNYAAVALTTGKTEEACKTIRYLLDNDYAPAEELAEMYCK